MVELQGAQSAVGVIAKKGTVNIINGSLDITDLNLLRVLTGATVNFEADAAVVGDALSFDGGGTLNFNGAPNTFGNFTVGSGIVNINAVESIADTSGVIMSGGILNVKASETIAALSGTSGTINLAADLISIPAAGSVNTYSGVLSGANDLVLRGDSTTKTILSGNNVAFTGDVKAESGVLSVGSSGALGTIAGSVLVTSGGAFDLNGNIYSGAVQLNSDAVFSGLNFTASGEISGLGGILKQGAGTVTLSSANSYYGTTSIEGGLILATGGSAIPDSSAVSMTGGNLTISATETIGSLSSTAGRVLTISDKQLTVNQLVSGTFLGSISGSTGSLVKTGTADLNLSGATLNVTELSSPLRGQRMIIAKSTTALNGTFAQTNLPADYVVDYSVPTEVALMKLQIGGGYAGWASASGLTVGVNDGKDQDPDDDGITNQLEYVLSGAPMSSDQSILPVAAVTGTDLSFSFKRNDNSESDMNLWVQFGSDLQGWTTMPIGATSSVIGPVVITITENGPLPDTISKRLRSS